MGDKTEIGTIERDPHGREDWVAVAGPFYCVCGHDHYGRQQFIDGQPTDLPPQYHQCDDPDCTCEVLRACSGR